MRADVVDRKDLRDHLDQQPAGHGVGGADLVDVAALEFSEK
jgi:hypothetical protein